MSRASAHASRAARPGSPGATQPYTSARIWAPIQSRNGLPRRPATVGLVAGEQVAVGHPLGGEHPAGGEPLEPRRRHVVGADRLPAALDEVEGDQREVHVVVLGHPVDVLGQAVRGAASVPGVRRRDRRVEPDGGEVRGDRPVPRRAGDRPDAAPADLLHRLAEQAPGGPTEPRPVQPIERRLGRHGMPAGGERGDGGEVVGLALAQPGRHLALVDEGQQSSRQLAQLGRGGIGRRPAGARLGATRRPRSSARAGRRRRRRRARRRRARGGGDPPAATR